MKKQPFWESRKFAFFANTLGVIIFLSALTYVYRSGEKWDEGTIGDYLTEANRTDPAELNQTKERTQPMALSIGKAAPNFSLLDTKETPISLTDLRGQWVVLYFYPKDDTPGCTIEANEFTAAQKEFEEKNTIILGVSPDPCKKHQKFTKKYDLTINLLSDESHEMLESYGVWQEKSMFGKKYMGVVRTTLLIDPEGTIQHIWEKVKVKGHVAAVLKKLTELQL